MDVLREILVAGIADLWLKLWEITVTSGLCISYSQYYIFLLTVQV